MSDNNNSSLAVKTEQAPAQWGDRQEVAAVARRLKAMLPNGNKLSESQLFSLAQYSQLTGLDIFSGAAHALPDGGMTNDYKILCSWAQRKEPFVEKYFPLSAEELDQEGLGGDVISAHYCYILKRSQQPMLLEFLKAGVAMRDALDLVANRGLGVVRESDITKRDGKKFDAPKTKSWVWVSQKRALRAAIGVAYGMPTLPELAALAQQAQADGVDQLEHLPQAARLASMAAEVRAESEAMTVEQHRSRLAQNAALMRDPVDSGIGDDDVVEAEAVEVGPEAEAVQATFEPADLFAPAGSESYYAAENGAA